MSIRVLVTGGAGFIGSAATSRLRADGAEAIAGARARGSKPRGGAIACDLDDAAQISSALAGVDAVVHAAYGADAAMERQCATLLDAMCAAKTRRLIYLSSIAVYGEAQGYAPETTPHAPLDAYGTAKVACERRVDDWARKGMGRATILRPGVVYGRGSPFWIDKLAARIRAGAWGTFGAAGEGVAALVHVDDVAALISKALLRPQGESAHAPEIMNVAGPQTPVWNDYFSALARALNAPPLPVLDAATVARRQKLALPAKVWRKLGLPGFERAALAPTPGEMALFGRKADYRTAAAERLAGFTPRIELAEGLKRSF